MGSWAGTAITIALSMDGMCKSLSGRQQLQYVDSGVAGAPAPVSSRLADQSASALLPYQDHYACSREHPAQRPSRSVTHVRRRQVTVVMVRHHEPYWPPRRHKILASGRKVCERNVSCNFMQFWLQGIVFAVYRVDQSHVLLI
jgi:hypothetical protein